MFLVTVLGKILILVGGVLIVVGVFLVLSPKLPLVGKLPGDIHIKRDNFELYIPLATSLIISAVVSGILWVISNFGKK